VIFGDFFSIMLQQFPLGPRRPKNDWRTDMGWQDPIVEEIRKATGKGS
jgi:hypothetical protein